MPPPALPVRGHEFALRVDQLQLADQRIARQWQLGAEVEVSPRHHLWLLLHYASIESDDDLISAGGPVRVQWSATWREDGWLRPATDLVIGLPTGDPDLHPLSAKAPHVEGRLRLQLPAGLWLGYFGRRVSPAKDRILSESYFPSGSGFDLGLRRSAGRLEFALDLRHPTAGLPDAGWAQLALSWRLSDELQVEAGGMAGIGPENARLAESGWRLGLRYGRQPEPPERSQAELP